MHLMVPEPLRAWSRFTMNSWPSDDTSFRYIASGPTQPPMAIAPEPEPEGAMVFLSFLLLFSIASSDFS